MVAVPAPPFIYASVPSPLPASGKILEPLAGDKAQGLVWAGPPTLLGNVRCQHEGGGREPGQPHALHRQPERLPGWVGVDRIPGMGVQEAPV